MDVCKKDVKVQVFYVIDTPTMDYDGAWMTNVELEMTILRTLEAMSDETMNLGSYEERDDRDEEGDKME